MELKNRTIAIIGAGNLGQAIAEGLIAAGFLAENRLIMTKRKLAALAGFEKQGITVTSDNSQAVSGADIVLLAVQPAQCKGVIEEMGRELRNKLVISTITGVKLSELKAMITSSDKIVRAMPNTALSVQQSMTCLSTCTTPEYTNLAASVFSVLGKTIVIEDELMQAATVLGASGIAFWLRLIRATTQGGIQLGFDAPVAQQIAVQTCMGAAALLNNGHGTHPEAEIDKVTTPRGCTIAGLNEMEHKGLSSALIRGLVASFDKINNL